MKSLRSVNLNCMPPTASYFIEHVKLEDFISGLKLSQSQILSPLIWNWSTLKHSL